MRSSVGFCLARLDMAGEIAGHLLDRAHHGGVVPDAEFEDLVDPLDEEVAVIFRDAEHVGDGANRNVLGVAGRGVAFALRDEFVDQLVADRANPGLQLLHGVGRERRQQQLLRRLVLRRIGGDRRRGIDDLGPDIAHDDPARGEMLGVVGDFLYRLIGGRHVAAEKAVGMNHRRCRPHGFPDRKRIFGPLRIGMVEIVHPIGDRRVIGCRGRGIGNDAGGIGHQVTPPVHSL